MHPNGTLRVRMDGDGDAPGARLGATTAFQDRTLFAYLRNQASIRKQLEDALAADQEQRWPDGEAVRGDVWSWARLLRLEFDEPNPKRKHVPETAFTLYFDCDWEEEHVVTARFEDGTLKEVSNE